MDYRNKNKIFSEWVNQYYKFGYRIAYKILVNEEDCRDIVQDAFLKVWMHFDTYNEEVKFTTWLYTIVTNLCYDKLRKKKSAVNYAESTVFQSKYEEGIENWMYEKDIRTTLIKLSENLSPKQRIVFVLRDLEEMEITEICTITNMDAQQIKANLYFARKAIRKNLISLNILEEKI